MGEGAFEQVAAFLAEREGIDPESIYPQSRLVQDLGMWGDDVVAFFSAVSERFGTDFAALEADWDRYFPREGGSWKYRVFGLPLMIATGVIAGFGAAAIGLPEGWVIPFAAVAAFGAIWLSGRLTRGPALVPVTVANVADAVARGKWA